ncbi:F-box domain-containing protein [Trichosporon asahii var. asahii CBS 8904]|uniref:F-box domain-containing protein n=1 Tax=Trichosporon asahii var. asahii (strain CBS 8904) TaxID=1220162 RepID=K1VM41_TRIAC|nr:F-box domain-containing protein [Trichosporon asahii var. asahii CBS 8904]
MVEPISDRLQRLDLSDPKASLAEGAEGTPGTPGTPASGSGSVTPSEIDTSELNSRSVSGAPTPAPAGAVPDDELERFRREWKEEVAAKRPGAVDVGPVKWTTAPAASGDAADKGKGKALVSSVEPEAPAPTSPVKLTRVISPEQARSPERRPAPVSPKKVTGIGLPARLVGQGLEATPAPASTSGAKIPFRAPRVRRNPLAAVEVYTQAVEAEQQGRLNDALKLYRQAFKMDDGVDRAYQREARARAEVEANTAAAAEEEGATSADIVDPRGPSEREYQFTRHIQLEADYARPLAPTSRLTALIDKYAHVKGVNPATGEEWEHSRLEEFAPLDAELPLPIANLPAEILDRIFRHLDVGAVERFGSTCWRARLLTEHTSLWHHLVKAVYRPPMLRDVSVPQLIHKHRGEWRSVFVEEERLRMDGVYIAVCHYIRPGAVTYHRFLRFYPNGTVLSFLTTDHPSDVVPMLKPSLRAKGLHIGRWRLVRMDEDEDEPETAAPSSPTKATTNGRTSPVKPTGPTKTTRNQPQKKRKHPKVVITELLEPGENTPKYEFEMELTLKETQRGRWNKLDLDHYASINLATGEALGLSLKHQKPFYFSKVRSYHPAL